MSEEQVKDAPVRTRRPSNDPERLAECVADLPLRSLSAFAAKLREIDSRTADALRGELGA